MVTNESILYCQERDVLCAFMGDHTGRRARCEREGCILDDPEHIRMKEEQEGRRREREEAERRHRQEEREAAPIRDQRNRIKSYAQMKMDEIHRLEEASRKAYLDNRPREGDDLFNRARFMRGELKKFEEERKKEMR